MRYLIRRRFLLILGLLFIELNNPLFGQEFTGEITGVIKDVQKNESLIGANILLVGTKLGSITDYNGKYTIKKIPAGDYTITVRFVSYKTENKRITVRAGESIEVNFKLNSSAVQMDEVVITGQGAAIEKRKLSSSVETISLREIEKSQVGSLDGLLQGKVVGLLSYLPSGMPGSGARIQSRGVKSALLATTPVIYVDGIRVDNNDNYRLAEDIGGQVSSSLSDLVIGDIERIEVLKGGAASTLYGSEAANGVIQVFTKRGLSGGVVPGAPKWKISAISGFDSPELKWTKEQLTKDRFYQDGFYQGYKLNVVGGTEMLSYNVSGSMNYNTGIITDDLLTDKVYNLFAGLRAVLGDRSDLQISANYVRHDFKSIFNDNMIWAPLGNFEYSRTFESSNTDNPDSLISIYLKPQIKEGVNRFTYSTNVTYSPFEEFSNKFTIGLDYRNNEQRAFAPKETENIVNQPGGFIHRNDREYLSLTLAYTGSYKAPSLGPVSQTISFGGQGFRVEDREFSGTGNNFAIPGTDLIPNASLITADESNRQLFSGGFFITDQVGIFDKVFLDLGLRFDGNSSFGKDVGLQTYPKAGIAYNVSDEDFYPEELKGIMGSLKLRTSWGVTGNFPLPFTRDRTYSSSTYFSAAGLNFENPGDKDLKPEKTTSIDAGFDAGFWDDRISIEFNYYKQTTKDALFSVATPSVGGFGPQERNVGEIENKGIEISLRFNAIKTNDIDLEIKGGLATVENKVLSMGGAAGFTIGGFSFAPKRIEKGYPIGVWSVSVPRVEADGSLKGNYDTKLMGNPTPKYTGSFGFDLNLFKDLSISMLGEYASGGDIQDLFSILRVLYGYEDALKLIPASTDPDYPYDFVTASSVFLEKSNWIRIRDITVRYHLQHLLPNGINFTLSLRNYFIFGVSALIDPEQNWSRSLRGLEVGGLGGDVISTPKQFRFGIEIPL